MVKSLGLILGELLLWGFERLRTNEGRRTSVVVIRGGIGGGREVVKRREQGKGRNISAWRFDDGKEKRRTERL